MREEKLFSMENSNNKIMIDILLDLYKLAEYFYRKGFLDAASLCDPVFCEKFSKREDNYAEIKMINDFDRESIEPLIYADLMTMYSSIIRAGHINIYLKFRATDCMKIRIAYLMDYVYREGIFDGRASSILNAKLQMSKDIQDISRNSVRISLSQWHDYLKFYINIIGIHHRKIKIDTGMDSLSNFITVALKLYNIEDEKNREYKRRRKEIIGG